MAETFYSVDEANALIPKLKSVLERIRQTQEELAKDKTVAGVLILDAVTVHEGEMERIGRTLK